MADPNCGTYRTYYNPSATVMPDGLAGLVFRASKSPYGAGDNLILFTAYRSAAGLGVPVELFPYDTNLVGITTYKGILVACAAQAATPGNIRVRTSTNNGLTWTNEAAMITSARTGYGQNGGTNRTGFRLIASKDQQTLYAFYMEWTGSAYTLRVMYRTTTSADPSQGWSAEAYSGFTITSIARNYGGTIDRNQGDTRAFAGPIETNTAGTWVIGAESNTGEYQANHAIFRGTLGGTWTQVFNDGYGGGLSGSQGANGNIFYDTNGNDLIAYAMSDNGESMTTWRSTDSGATWGSAFDEINNFVPVGTGTGDGASFLGSSRIFSGLAGLEPAGTETNDLYVTICGTPTDFTSILGEQQSGSFTCTAPSYNSTYRPVILPLCIIALPLTWKFVAVSEVVSFNAEYVSAWSAATTGSSLFDNAIFDNVSFDTAVPGPEVPSGRLYAKSMVSEIADALGTTLT